MNNVHATQTCIFCLKGYYDVTEDCVMHHNMTTLNGRCLLRSIPRLVYPRKALIHGYSLRSSTLHPKSSFSFVTLLGPLTKRGVPPARPLGVRNFTFRLGKSLAGCAFKCNTPTVVGLLCACAYDRMMIRGCWLLCGN